MTNNMITNTVLEMGQVAFRGNIIDDAWFQHITFENGKAYMNAVLILSEICYWYTPTEVKDEVSGMLLGYKKKFAADKLQKSYDAFADKFGFSKRQAKSACDYLKDNGYITVEFRDIITRTGMKLNNVMFVEPIVSRIKEISSLYIKPMETLNNTVDAPPPTIECTTPHNIMYHPPQHNVPGGAIDCRTNTKTTTKTTTEISSINQSSIDENESVSNNKVDLNRLIDLDKQLLENNFKTYKNLINYVGIDKNCFEYPYTEYIDAIKRAIEEMYYFDYTKIKNRKICRFDIISKLQNLQYDMIKACIDKFIESSKSQVIEYPVAFIKSTLFNEIDEYSARIQAQINFDFSDLPSGDENKKLTRFHNFKGRTSNYTADELEEIANKKRKEYSSRQKTL